MQYMKYLADSLEKMAQLATLIVDGLEKKNRQAVVLGLQGDLGSGKTTFAQDVAKYLGVTEEVTSPTFIIQKSYQLPEGKKFSRLVHIDAYRLDASEQLERLGFAELLKEEDTLIIVEWPEKVPKALPQHTQSLLFTFVNDTTREVIYGED